MMSISNPLDRIMRGGGLFRLLSNGEADFNKSLAIGGPRPWIDVTSQAYGADPTGVADSTAALNAAWTALSSFNGVLFLPPGIYSVSDELDWRDKAFVTIVAYGAQIITRSGSTFGATKSVVNLSGTRESEIHGLRITSDLAGADRPGACLVLSRTLNDGTRIGLYRCTFDGACVVATVYNAGSEMTIFVNCSFFASSSGQSLVWDTDNDTIIQLGGGGEYSNVGKHYFNCEFYHQIAGAVNTEIITLAGLNFENSFYDCYFNQTNSSGICKVFNLIDVTTPDPNSSANKIIIQGGRYEQAAPNAGTRLVYNAKQLGNTQMLIRAFGWTIAAATYLLDDAAGAGTNSSEFDWWPSGAQKFAHILTGCSFRSNKLFGNFNAAIDVDAGAFATENFVWMSNAGYPFAGAGTFEGLLRQDNIIICSGSFDSYISLPAWRTRENVFTSLDTTPSVRGLHLHVVLNAGATSITALDTAETGQFVILLFKDAVTTLVHGTGADALRLRDEVNYLVPINTVMAFQRDENSSNVWRECYRSATTEGRRYTYKDADESVVNATLQDDDELTLSLAASGKYHFKFEIFYTTVSATAGIQVAIGGTVGVTSMKAQIGIWDDVTTNALVAYARVVAKAVPINAITPAGDNRVIIEGTIEASTAGTLLLSWAQQVTDAANATIVQRGSSLELDRMP